LTFFRQVLELQKFSGSFYSIVPSFARTFGMNFFNPEAIRAELLPKGAGKACGLALTKLI